MKKPGVWQAKVAGCRLAVYAAGGDSKWRK